MADIIRVVFSGPCAYVPNIVEGAASAAVSWSVLLPNLRLGWSGDKDGIKADRHLPVLSYCTDDFESDVMPDIKLKYQESWGKYRENDIFFLKACRVTFDKTDSLVVDQTSIESVREDPKKISELIAKHDALLRSMEWLPSMSWLRSRLKWFGSKESDYYFDDDGFPNPDTNILAGHVLLKSGNLIAGDLDVSLADQRYEPTIWAFKPYRATATGKERRQALAGAVVLELPISASIMLTYPRYKVKINPKKQAGVLTLEIKNREAEEILMPGAFEFEPQGVDFDFRYLYSHASHYDPDCTCYAIPHQVYPGGGGNEAGTCGGNQFQGFASDFESKMEKW